MTVTKPVSTVPTHLVQNQALAALQAELESNTEKERALQIKLVEIQDELSERKARSIALADAINIVRNAFRAKQQVA